MKRGLYVPPFGTSGDVNLLVELAVTAEQVGWDGLPLRGGRRHVALRVDVAGLA